MQRFPVYRRTSPSDETRRHSSGRNSDRFGPICAAHRQYSRSRFQKPEEESPDAPLKADPEQLLGFDREFHRQLLQHFAREAVDDERYRAFGIKSAHLGVEQLVVAD